MWTWKKKDHFRTGLVCLQKVHRLAPEVPQYREYFDRNLDNYARLLRKIGKPFHAATVTHRRAELYEKDATELARIAKSLTLAIPDMPEGVRRRKWEQKTAKVLNAAVQAGWTPPSDAEREAFSLVLGEAMHREVTWPDSVQVGRSKWSDVDGGRS